MSGFRWDTFFLFFFVTLSPGLILAALNWSTFKLGLREISRRFK